MKNTLIGLLFLTSFSSIASECKFFAFEENLKSLPKTIEVLEGLNYQLSTQDSSEFYLGLDLDVMIYGGILDDHDVRAVAFFGRNKAGTDSVSVMHSSSSFGWGPFPTKEENMGKFAIKSSDRKLAKEIKENLKACQ